MDDDWDLHAVVKGCSAAATTTRVSAATTSTDNNPFPSFSSMNFHDDQNSFDFHGIIDHDGNDPFQGLQEIYQEFCGDPSPPTAASSTVSVMAAQVFQPHQEIMQIQPSLGMNMQMQGNILKNPIQTKLVRQMTQEELSADSWAWRKYGQKPIKGSPYPRNYYRCSTSKGCAARKQVERSPNDPGIFVVSYSGEHTHPRPSHRSSLAGSTRNKISTTAATATAARINNNNNSLLLQKGSVSSSSPSGSSFSPNTPLMEGEAAAQNIDAEMVEEEDGGGDEDDDDDNNIMINPNDLVNDDGEMFKGFQDSDQSSGGGDLFSSGLLSSPPWTPTSSAATFNG
ncbi:hypothetical protein BUALT_Bualt06G0102200 [Buddleja alternifolia]|uniref:WRKY domain-containing protein n=1 Tax=Buddleja alternifolia TaxID=168488 RepID=A0AAV6XFN3_9LAMI|nr:hypothetical protein BUALT_Bualt06G0102200 [Buddleja alternifolia]